SNPILKELASGLLGFELLEDRLDGLARPAPGRPEVDDHGCFRLENFLFEACVREFVHAADAIAGRSGPGGGARGPSTLPRRRSGGSSSNAPPRGRRR